MSVSLTEEHFKKLVYKDLYSAYNKHFLYYSVIEKSVRLGLNIKGIASKLTLPKAVPNMSKLCN